jgi:hypothetical protein
LIFWWSCWIPAYFFYISWVVWLRQTTLISILSLSSEILSSTCSSLLEWPSTVFFVWLKGLFISKDFCLILFFLRFSVSLFSSSFIFCCLLYVIYLSFYNTLCFTLVFVVLSVYLVVSVLLKFFITDVLKFLECVLYFIFNCV